MTRRAIDGAILAALAFVLAAGFGLGCWLTRPDDARPVPACQEDTVLVGSGDFEPDWSQPGTGGRWAAYVCGPAVDDFQEVTP